MWNPELAFAEGYTDGSIEVDADLTDLMESVNLALSTRHSPSTDAGAGPVRTARLRSARRQAQHHYNLGNDFFALWLDDAMVYTCAYYDAPDATLERAQRAKHEHVCRKLRLQRGDEVIEAGSGWGALALYMAREYGVRVRSYNISSEQILYAREQARRQGLSDRVAFIDGDFRSIEGRCDAFVSVGMLEHIGKDQYGPLGEIIHRTLHPRAGRGLLHFIGRNQRMPVAEWTRRHIFPGTYAPVLSEVAAQVFEPWNLSIVDVENLRRHYAMTLRDWRLRFERAAGSVERQFDRRFVRMWRLYLASAEASFRSGDSQLFQVVFARPADTSLDLTRRHLYEAPADADHAVM